jgi:hypothetical protein
MNIASVVGQDFGQHGDERGYIVTPAGRQHRRLQTELGLAEAAQDGGAVSPQQDVLRGAVAVDDA